MNERIMKSKKNMELTLSIIAAATVLLGTGLGFYLNYRVQDETKNKQNQIENLNREIDKKVKINSELSEKILELSGQVKDLTEQNVNMTSKVFEMSDFISKVQTGGDGFIELIVAHGPPNRTVEYWVMPHGEFVLRSVSINILDNVRHKELIIKLDFKKMNQDQFADYWESPIYKKSYRLGNVIPKTKKTVDKYSLSRSQNEISLMIDIFAENGTFRQKIRQIDLWGKMLSATEIRNSNGDLIYEKISEGFPRNKEGSVLW